MIDRLQAQWQHTPVHGILSVRCEDNEKDAFRVVRSFSSRNCDPAKRIFHGIIAKNPSIEARVLR
jgi:hypothetical protein